MLVRRPNCLFRTLLRRFTPRAGRRAAGAALALGLAWGAADRVDAQSFSVDRQSFGVPGTAVGALAVAEEHIFTNVAPPGPVPPGVAFSGMNFVDRFFPGGPDLDALSAGYDPVDKPLYAIVFSVDRTTQGTVGSDVRARRSAGHGAESDLYYTSRATGAGTNRLLSLNDLHHGLSDGPLMALNIPDNIDAGEIFDSRRPTETPYQGFRFHRDWVFDSINTGSTMDAVIRLNGAPLIWPKDLGLQEKDNIDALAMDYRFEKDGAGDGFPEVLFSLAPGSITLAGADGVPFTADDLSPADIFYSDLSGKFDVAGPTGLLGNFPGNTDFPFDLTAKNLGLQFFPINRMMDNIDTLDILASRTVYQLDKDPHGPTGVPIPDGVKVPGDFDFDGPVRHADLRWWELGFGKPTLATGPSGDADGDGDSDGVDLLIWQQNLGLGEGLSPAAAASAASVPEPTAACLTGLAAAVACGLRGSRRREQAV